MAACRCLLVPPCHRVAPGAASHLVTFPCGRKNLPSHTRLLSAGTGQAQRSHSLRQTWRQGAPWAPASGQPASRPSPAGVHNPRKPRPEGGREHRRQAPAGCWAASSMGGWWCGAPLHAEIIIFVGRSGKVRAREGSSDDWNRWPMTKGGGREGRAGLFRPATAR